jgi:hypothetical protein
VQLYAIFSDVQEYLKKIMFFAPELGFIIQSRC